MIRTAGEVIQPFRKNPAVSLCEFPKCGPQDFARDSSDAELDLETKVNFRLYWLVFVMTNSIIQATNNH